MPLATIENVIVTVGDGAHTVSLTIEEDGLVVGSFGKLPWAGSAVAAEVGDDGCIVDVDGVGGVHTRYFIPAASFATLGGARVMRAFSHSLLRSAVTAGGRVVQPVA